MDVLTLNKTQSQQSVSHNLPTPKEAKFSHLVLHSLKTKKYLKIVLNLLVNIL